MNKIHVVIVVHHALNEQLNGTARSCSSQIMTSGLCLSEHYRGHQFEMPSMRFDFQNRSFLGFSDTHELKLIISHTKYI